MRAFVFLLLGVLGAGPAWAQVDCNEGLEPLDSKAESRITATDFVRTVVGNEVVLTRAMAEFAYTLEVSYQTLDAGGQVDGTFNQTLKVDFEDGVRRVRPVGDAVSTLQRVRPPRIDVDQLSNAFTLTPDLVARRDVVYSGRQKVDDFNAVVFDILPRDGQLVSGFAGRTWVRRRDNQIARFCGRMEDGPFGSLRYLVQRAWVAGKFWLPVRIRAGEPLRSADGSEVPVRLDVRYAGYVAR